MLKKEILIPLLLAVVVIAFALISLLVRLHPRGPFLRAKLRLGGLILTLTLISACAPPEPSCYEMPPIDDSIVPADSLSHKDTLVEKNTETGNIQKPQKPQLKIDSAIQDPQPSQTIRCYVPIHDDRDTNF